MLELPDQENQDSMEREKTEGMCRGVVEGYV